MRISKLIWREEVIDKVRSKHNVSPEEVKEICSGRKWVLRGREETYYVLGQTEAGRYLLIALSQKNLGQYKVVTAREMDKSEKRRFKERKKRGL